ncbi:NAD-dependent epimerase/dehydratase family protein [Microbacterium sp. ASV49]|uniref:NAD-dependent epimerase/dehydratase family protein n=1 Tax=Microbacterium candidum TaxID=3041922 RepID=A0ABT7MVR9_9MICO|nr:NAD-dependent epimerase/dehydratase family protein [Microbacterium sp. ASV49]MDL9978546.1 NAD-dependent epimerase/dehydratase family protein [Microbacterium sp. ASV49]
MRILLTGATGYVGSAVLDELVGAGHEVVALVRSVAAAEQVRAKDARAEIGDAADADRLAGLLATTDAVIHTAASDDPVALNTAIADAVERAYAGTERRLVLTSGIWIYGDGDDIQDDDIPKPADLVAWRVPIEDRLLAGPVSTTIVAPGVVYGRGESLLPIARGGVGDGAQHWTWVHVDDLARLYRLVVEHPTALGRVIASDGVPVAVRDVAGPEARVETADEARARLGTAFADALLLDQRAYGAKARSLGWQPRHAVEPQTLVVR